MKKAMVEDAHELRAVADEILRTIQGESLLGGAFEDTLGRLTDQSALLEKITTAIQMAVKCLEEQWVALVKIWGFNIFSKMKELIKQK